MAKKQTQKDRLYNEYLKGYRAGFDKGHEAGKRKGREELQSALRALLDVPRDIESST